MHAIGGDGGGKEGTEGGIRESRQAGGQQSEEDFSIHGSYCCTYLCVFLFVVVVLSGGLMICLPASNAAAFCAELSALDGEPVWIIGDVIAASDGKTRVAALNKDVNILEV